LAGLVVVVGGLVGHVFATHATTYALRINSGVVVASVPAVEIGGWILAPVRWVAQPLGAVVHQPPGHVVVVQGPGSPTLQVATASRVGNTVTGVVTNTGGQAANQVHVTITEWNAQGAVVQTPSVAVTPSRLGPRASGHFIFHGPIPATVAALDVMATSVNTVGATVGYTDVATNDQTLVPMSLTVDSVRFASTIPTTFGTPDKPPAGDVFLVAAVTLKDAGQSAMQPCPANWSYVTDASGARYHESQAVDDMGQGIGCVQNPLMPGQVLRGTIVYAVPATDSAVQLWYGNPQTSSYAVFTLPGPTAH
jgi:hypothetical protein